MAVCAPEVRPEEREEAQVVWAGHALADCERAAETECAEAEGASARKLTSVVRSGKARVAAETERDVRAYRSNVQLLTIGAFEFGGVLGVALALALELLELGWATPRGIEEEQELADEAEDREEADEEEQEEEHDCLREPLSELLLLRLGAPSASKWACCTWFNWSPLAWCLGCARRAWCAWCAP